MARDVWERFLRDRRLRPETRLRIAQALLDRQHGRPKQEIEGRLDGPIVVVKNRDQDF